jgi:hypothetical protein
VSALLCLGVKATAALALAVERVWLMFFEMCWCVANMLVRASPKQLDAV